MMSFYKQFFFSGLLFIKNQWDEISYVIISAHSNLEYAEYQFKLYRFTGL